MVIFDFKPTSFLNTPVARVLNAIIVIPLLLLCSVTTFSLKIDGTNCLPILYIIFSVCGGISIILNRNKWIEYDKRETKRKESFILSYICLALILSYTISTFILKAIECYSNGESILLYLAVILYLAFNQINLCSLYNFGDYFENRLSAYDYETHPLPKIEKDVIKYVLRTDHNIDLDELLYEIESWRDAYNDKYEKPKREH